MNDLKRRALRVEANFAACEGSYWVSFCAVSGFVAVFLSHRGLSDTQIGLTTSFGSAMAIALQLVLSNVLDQHPELPIKRLISVLFVVGIASVACMQYLPLPTAMMIVAFATCYAMGLCGNGYLNAQLMQYQNAGIPARYGWPRGVGSFCYAASAYAYGKLAEMFTPDVLMPCYMVGTAVCILCVMLMPDPNAGRPGVPRPREERTTYREMLSGNRTLVVMLLCTLLNGIGNMAGYTFILRVVQRLGGGTAEYGISEFIRAGAEVPALFASGYLLRHFKVKSMLSASFLFYGVRLLLLAFATGIGAVYAASALNMLCVGLSTFSSVILVNRIVRENEKVRGQSLCVLCGSVGSIIGSAYAGAMIDHVGLTAMLLTSTLFCMLAWLGMVFLCKPDREPAHV